MPTQVFWTRRTEEQIRQDVIPLPNFNLLPKEYWKLYPTLFKSPTQVETFPFIKQTDSLISQQSTKSRIEMQVSSETPATGDHEKRDDEVEIIEDEHSFDSLKKREETRKKRKSRASKQPVLSCRLLNNSTPGIPRDEDGRTPGKKKFKGVVLTRQPADPSVSCYSPFYCNFCINPFQTRSKNGDSNALRKPLPLRPVEERTVTGGRNFDFKIVEEATKQKQVSNRVQIFTDIQSNLKTALALRFAKKEFTDRLTEVISENVPVIQKDEINLYAKREMLQRVSEKFPMIMETPAPIIKREKRSRSESRQPGTPEEDSDINKDIGFVMTKKAIESFKKMEQASTLSSRLGITVEDFDTCSKRPPSTLRTDLYGRVPQVNSGSATNDSSSIASGQEVPDNESPDPKSQEISASVQRHIQTLKAKMERQRKKKVHKRKRQEVCFAFGI